MRTAKRALRTSLLLMLPVGVVGGSLYVAHRHQAQAANDLSTTCYGNLGGTTYPSGVASASLASNTAVSVQPGTGLQLNTALAPFNAQQITLPFDQQVDVKYVYRNAGASHSFGWFYLDQISQFLNADGSLKDQDGDKIYDWFEPAKGTTRPNTGLWQMTTAGIPDIANSAYNYSDGGTFPHVPNTLEALTTAGKGMWLFKLCDDDGDLSTYGVGSTVGSYPISDVSTNSDGIPDYDVNGDGTIGNEADRTVNMGVVQGNREIVFFAVTYYSSQLPKSGLGMGIQGSGEYNAYAMPFFTKNILNPDRNTLTPGQLLDRCAIKCYPLESGGDPTCYAAAAGGPATNGWLTPDAQTRLNTATYGYTSIANDPSVYNITVGSDGSAPHFVVLPPASNPNLWLIGYEDLPSNEGDNDFNDVVFMVERSNGGQVISNVISNDIPPSAQSTTQISTINVQYNVSLPAPGCTGVTGAQINLYWSVNAGVTWNAVPMASLLSGNVTIDVLGSGQIGSQLEWRADFVSPVQACQPVLTNMNMTYAAVQHGLFKYAAPIPLSNMVYAGELETPPYPATENAVTREDYSLRGHFNGNQLYNAATDTQNTTPPLLWDSGMKASMAASPYSAKTPDQRNIYTSTTSGTTVTTVPFTIANGASLYPLVLPTASRTALNNATLVYDYNGDAVVDNNDAQHLVQWTRGWEFASGITYTPAETALMRAWRLGSLHNSSPAVVGPPVRPVWIDGSAAPPLLAAAHNNFRTLPANEARATRAFVGAQDGMLHAFTAGAYRPVGDPDTTEVCTNTLYRGCFANVSGQPADYGDGSEAWAWIPPSQLSQLKNNTPTTKGYLPGSNPQAEVDGSVSVDDVFDQTLLSGQGSFRTMVYASLGTSQRYITAVDATNPTTPTAVWAADWTDSAFNGTDLSPSIALSQTGATTATYNHVLVVTSGLAGLASDLYMYVIDALKGTTTQKIKLNVGSNTAQSTGFASYANLVDANQDGLVDRAYAVDTTGRIFKVDLTTNTSCVIASLGETVYSGMAVSLENSSTVTVPKVQLFVGGGSDPDGTGTVASSYDFFSYEDDDPVGTCSSNKASLVYKYNLGSTNGVANKVWAAPTVIADATGAGQVFVSTASATSESVCATGTGAINVLPTIGNGSGSVTPSQAAIAVSGAPISSMSVYDGHAMVNTTGGTTTVIGGSAWNNQPTNSNVTGATTQIGLINAMSTLMWQEL